MTIEIHNAELERLLEERLRERAGASVEDVLLRALKKDSGPSDASEPSETLVEFFRRSPLVGLELDLHRVE
jgi:hypothetical protein